MLQDSSCSAKESSSLADIRQRPRPFLGVGALAVPGGVVLHERDALAFDGVGDDHAGAARGLFRALQGLDDLALVVAVALLHLPAEGAPLIGKRLRAHDVLDEAVVLDAVAVDDGSQGGEAVVGGRPRRLPDLAFVQLAVAEEAVDAVVAAVQARRQAPTDGGRPPLTEPPDSSTPGTDQALLGPCRRLPSLRKVSSSSKGR